MLNLTKCFLEKNGQSAVSSCANNINYVLRCVVYNGKAQLSFITFLQQNCTQISFNKIQRFYFGPPGIYCVMSVSLHFFFLLTSIKELILSMQVYIKNRRDSRSFTTSPERRSTKDAKYPRLHRQSTAIDESSLPPNVGARRGSQPTLSADPEDSSGG